MAAVISSLRRIDGVQRVTLSSAEKLGDTGAAGDSGGNSNGDCRNGNAHYPQFSMTLFFDAPAAAGTQGTTP